jgi:hypothetical protein
MSIESKLVDIWTLAGDHTPDGLFALRAIKYSVRVLWEDLARALDKLSKEVVLYKDESVTLELNQYQASALMDLLRLVSARGAIVNKKVIEEIKDRKINREDVICANNGDWLGEIRWMLEPQVTADHSNFGELPDWCAQKGNYLPIKRK